MLCPTRYGARAKTSPPASAAPRPRPRARSHQHVRPPAATNESRTTRLYAHTCPSRRSSGQDGSPSSHPWTFGAPPPRAGRIRVGPRRGDAPELVPDQPEGPTELEVVAGCRLAVTLSRRPREVAAVDVANGRPGGDERRDEVDAEREEDEAAASTASRPGSSRPSFHAADRIGCGDERLCRIRARRMLLPAVGTLRLGETPSRSLRRRCAARSALACSTKMRRRPCAGAGCRPGWTSCIRAARSARAASWRLTRRHRASGRRTGTLGSRRSSRPATAGAEDVSLAPAGRLVVSGLFLAVRPDGKPVRPLGDLRQLVASRPHVRFRVVGPPSRHFAPQVAK